MKKYLIFDFDYRRESFRFGEETKENYVVANFKAAFNKIFNAKIKSDLNSRKTREIDDENIQSISANVQSASVLFCERAGVLQLFSQNFKCTGMAEFIMVQPGIFSYLFVRKTVFFIDF